MIDEDNSEDSVKVSHDGGSLDCPRCGGWEDLPKVEHACASELASVIGVFVRLHENCARVEAINTQGTASWGGLAKVVQRLLPVDEEADRIVAAYEASLPKDPPPTPLKIRRSFFGRRNHVWNAVRRVKSMRLRLDNAARRAKLCSDRVRESIRLACEVERERELSVKILLDQCRDIVLGKREGGNA